MSKRILIFTKAHDEHALTIAAGLEELGAQPTLFRFSMMPYFETHSMNLGDFAEFFVDETSLLQEVAPYDRIWLRRIGSSSVKLANIDSSDRLYVTKIIAAYTQSFLAFLDGMAAERPNVMVNSYSSKLSADSKMYQTWAAKKVGLHVPDTLQSNNPEAIKAFQRRHGGAIICKPLVPQLWRNDHHRAFCFTTMMPPVEQVPADALRLHPAIYQPYVEKNFEARIIVFGGRQFGMKIDSQKQSATKLDWRGGRQRINGNELYQLPDDVFQACINLMAKLKIAYGAFDFIVTPSGEHVFLEVNEAGQFLFVEQCAPENKIAHAFCHFLIHGDLSEWREEDATFSLHDLFDKPRYIERRMAEGRYEDYDRDALVSDYDDAVGSLNIDLRLQAETA